MANEEQVELLRRDVAEWNTWREAYREEDVDLSEADLREAHLYRADLSGADLSEAFLSGADLSGANLGRANLGRANLREADLSGANLGRANLGRANLREADLSRAILSGANLSGADLSEVSLSKATLHFADLSGADLSEADLSGAHLGRANLSGATLSGANLGEANLSVVDLNGADLSGATLVETVFASNDLQMTKGLLEVFHHGRSRIDLPTVLLPRDGSAQHFLRGAGVPDEWIDFYRSTMQSPIQYHSCFISYASPDLAFAKRLHADLQDRGVRCWFAPHDLVPGDYFREKIDQAIHVQEKLLLILSEASVQSNWVRYEVRKALNREVNQNRTILFPVRIDESIFQHPSPWARELREERHIGDFTGWDHDNAAYQKCFETLLKQFKADAL